MIKLKHILNEINAGSTLDVLNSKNYYKMYPDKLLYRATDDFDDNVRIVNIKKDRLPRNTSPFANAVFEVFRQQLCPNLPKRSETLFATTKWQTARSYGQRVYVVIPEISCEIFQMPIADSYGIFEEIENLQLNIISIEQTMIGIDSKTKFVENLSQNYKNLYAIHSAKTEDINKINVYELLSDISKLEDISYNNRDEDGDNNERFQSMIRSYKMIYDFFKGIKQISDLNEMKGEPETAPISIFEEFDYEICISGRSVYLIEESIFGHKFSYDTTHNKWVAGSQG